MKNKIIFKTLMLKGEAGSTIVSMEKTGHVGTADIYTITFNDGSTTEILLENMSAITSVEMTSSTDTEDIYTITCADGSTQTFSVLNHNADIAAMSDDIDTIDARVDNFINSVVPNTVETLWTGSIGVVGDSATLSKAVSNFDYIDLYLLGDADSKYIRVPATQTVVQIQQQNLSDDASSNFLRLWEMGVSISGTTVSITKSIAWSWDTPGSADPTVTANAQNAIPITRIDGVKAASDTPAEVTDIRVGADGVTYDSAGNAARGQYNKLVDALNDITKASPIPHTNLEHTYLVNGSTVAMSDGVPDPVGNDSNYYESCITCAEGDVFTIYGTGGINARLFAFIKSDGTILQASQENHVENGGVYIAPENSAFLIIQTKTTDARQSYRGMTLDLLTGLYKYFNYKNLFDKNSDNNLLNGYYSDGTTFNSSTTLGQTEMIPVVENHSYAMTPNNTFVLWYKSDQSYGGKLSSNAAGHFRMPVNAAYARFIFVLNTINDFWIYETNNVFDPILSSDAPISLKITEVVDARGNYSNLNDRLDSLEHGDNDYNGLNGVAFGTSLTYRAQSTGGYLQYLPALCGATIDNRGVGSSVIFNNGSQPDMLATIKAYTGYASKDFAILEGFVNDWYYNGASLGTYKDTTETSVCGCVRSALTYILTQNPEITLMLVIDPVGKSASGVDCSSLAERSNLTQKEFYDEVSKVANTLGVPVIRLDEISGMNENTPYMYIDNIHPTAEGAEQTANAIWSVMKNIPLKIADSN